MFYLYLEDKQLKQQINDAGGLMSTAQTQLKLTFTQAP